jgi:hypothetical protein
LALEASNNQKNFNANQIYKETGSSPNQAIDKRTTTDKYAGEEGMKQLVRDTISGADFMNAIEAGQVVDKMNGEDIDFFMKYKSFILTDFKGRGVPAKVFYDYLRRLREKQETTAGVEFGLADNTSQALLESMGALADNAEQGKVLGRALEELVTSGGQRDAGLSRLLIKSMKEWEKTQLTEEELDVCLEAERRGSPNVEPIQRILGEVAATRADDQQVREAFDSLNRMKSAAAPGAIVPFGGEERYRDAAKELIDLTTQPRENKALISEAKKLVAELKRENEDAKRMEKQIDQQRARFEATDRTIPDEVLRQNAAIETIKTRLEGRRGKAVFEERVRTKKAAAKAAADAEAFAGAFADLGDDLFEDVVARPAAAAAPAAAAPAREEGGPQFAALPQAQQITVRQQIKTHAVGGTLDEKLNNLVDWCEGQRRAGKPGWEDVELADIQDAARVVSNDNDNTFNEFKMLLAFVEQSKLRAAGAPPAKGSGMRGRGIGRKRSAVERSEGYKKPAAYKQLGRYLVNHHKLRDGILMVKSPSGAAVKQIPTQSVSSHYADALHYIAGGHTPPLDLFDRLSKEEKAHLHNVVKHSRVEGTGVPNPQKEDEDKDIHRFHILKGEIIAGNDSTPLAREFKGLLIKLMRQGRIPRREGNEILEELLHLGH